jgi:superfamily I DNA/RNA helicase
LADAESKTSFYVFYDELQSVQTDWVPKFILNAECRLTLHRNCRNTENISETAASLLKKSENRTFLLTAGAITGKIPCLHFCEDVGSSISALDEILDGLKRDGIDDIVILALRTVDESFLNGYAADGTYGGFRFTTCRKFKGLEADAVILVDFTERTVLKDDMLFYVGASRARVRLDIMTMMDNESCKRAVEQAGETGRRPMRDLASALKCTARVHHKGE